MVCMHGVEAIDVSRQSFSLPLPPRIPNWITAITLSLPECIPSKVDGKCCLVFGKNTHTPLSTNGERDLKQVK